MKIKRTGRDTLGRKYELTDEQLVERFLEGFVDQYSGGELEQMREKIDNIARNTAEILLALNRRAVLKICEEEALPRSKF